VKKAKNWQYTWFLRKDTGELKEKVEEIDSWFNSSVRVLTNVLIVVLFKHIITSDTKQNRYSINSEIEQIVNRLGQNGLQFDIDLYPKKSAKDLCLL